MFTNGKLVNLAPCYLSYCDQALSLTNWFGKSGTCGHLCHFLERAGGEPAIEKVDFQLGKNIQFKFMILVVGKEV